LAPKRKKNPKKKFKAKEEQREMKRTVFSYPYIVWMIIFIFSPVLLIVYYAFTSGGTFTLNNVRDALASTIYMPVLLRSVIVALEATLICILLGYPVAYLLSKMKRSTASLLSVLFIVPMWMNFLLRTYAWQVILDSSGILNSLLKAFGLEPLHLLYTEGAVMLGTVYNFLPFMILPIYTVLIKLDKSHIEAAQDLGANGVTTFMKVVLPLSMPGVISGITMVFIPAITTFAISRLLGGGKYRLYGDLIEQKIVSDGDLGLGSVLSLILLVLVLISIFIMRRAEKTSGSEGGTLW
jgi:spermidine/putrescine transport system permease protein